MRVLVTGGAGYIGCHIARRLFEEGHVPIIFDNLSMGHRYLVQGHRFVNADLNDRKALDSALYDVEAVVHLAASCTVADSVLQPREYYHNNVANSMNLIDACLDNNVNKLIVSSTCAVYGIPAVMPVSEDAPARPISPYGLTKLMVEQLLKVYSEAYDLHYLSLRYFNVAGAHESGELREHHDPETHLIPSALAQLRKQDRSISIYGRNYPTPDGTCVRDYVHVHDVAEAHLCALKYLSQQQSSSEVINIGSGRGHSVKEVLGAIQDITGQAVTVNWIDRRPGDAPFLVADITRAATLLSWRPQFTLGDMIRSAWATMR